MRVLSLDIFTTKKEQVHNTMIWTLAGEASTMGFAVGEWPIEFVVKNYKTGKSFKFRKGYAMDNEYGFVYYAIRNDEGMPIRVKAFND